MIIKPIMKYGKLVNTSFPKEDTMLKKPMIIILILLIGLLLPSCSNDSLRLKDLEGVWIPSLDDVFASIDAKAHELDPESKLQKIWFQLFPEYDDTDLLVFAYYDNILDDEYIQIFYYQDGLIKGEVVDFGGLISLPSSNKQLPTLNLDESIISTSDALDILIDYADLNSSYSNCIYCSSLVLSVNESQGVIQTKWILYLDDCLGDFQKQIEMDAHTGELLYID